MSTPQMDAWVTRLLGVSLTSGGGGARGDGKPARTPRPLDLRVAAPGPRPMAHVSVEGRARWAEARGEVDERIGRLMSRLEATGDPDLERIADLGLMALTRGLNTSLVASLIDVDAAAPDRIDGARAKAQGAVAAMRRFIGSDPLIALMDDNPMGVAVDIRGTLGGALQQIEKALA